MLAGIFYHLQQKFSPDPRYGIVVFPIRCRCRSVLVMLFVELACCAFWNSWLSESIRSFAKCTGSGSYGAAPIEVSGPKSKTTSLNPALFLCSMPNFWLKTVHTFICLLALWQFFHQMVMWKCLRNCLILALDIRNNRIWYLNEIIFYNFFNTGWQLNYVWILKF